MGADRAEIEQFLYREARLLDTQQFEAWLDLFTEDACYWVPAGRDCIAPKPQRKQKSAAPRLSPRKDALLRHSPCPETDT